MGPTVRACVGLALVVCIACVGPARTDEAYRAKGQASAASSLSAVRTAELAVEAVERDGIFSPQLSIVVSEAADEASHAQQAFASIQPPSPSLDSYRTRLDRALTDAASALARVRIAARRTDEPSLASATEDLPAIGATLERFAGDEA